MRILIFSAITSVLLLCSQVTPVLASKTRLQIGDSYPIHVSSIDADSDIAPVLADSNNQGQSVKKTYTIFHQDASYISLHFANMDLDTNCTFEVSDASGGQMYEMKSCGRHDLSTFWARHIQGDTVVFSSYCKGENKKEDFIVDKYVAGYKNVDMSGASERTRNLRGDKDELFPLEGRGLSLCGDNDMRNAQCYDGTTEYTKAKAVARLIIEGAYVCTGWLVGPNNHFVTNNHCVSTNDAALNTDYDFMYEVTGGGDCSTQAGNEPVGGFWRYDGQAMILTDATNDYTVISLQGNPAGTHGYLEMDNRVPAVGEKIYIPQHPGGSDKIIGMYDSSLGANARCEVKSNASGGSCNSGVAYSDIRYSCDTQGGSSGSPVLSVDTHKVVALHMCGGACDGNRAVPISEIHDEIQVAMGGTVSPTVSPIICPDGTHTFHLDMTLDGFPTETSWTLEDTGGVVASGGNYAVANKDIDFYQCLTDGVHTFTINDSYGDGVCCGYGNGSYKVFYDGVQVASGGTSFSQASVSFGSAVVTTPVPTMTMAPTLPPTPEPTRDPTPLPTPEPTPPPTTVAPTLPPTPEPTRDPTPLPTPSPTQPPTTAPPTPEPTPDVTLAPATVSPEAPVASSNGDPHFKTWKNEHFEYHGQCDMILVKDDTFANGIGLEVQIRTKLVRFWSYIRSVSIRIGDDILEIEGSADAYPFPSKEILYWINLEYQGELKALGGFPVKSWRHGELRQYFVIDLSSKFPGEEIEISTFREFIRVDFKNGSEESFGNAVGLLGDFKTGKTVARNGVTTLDDFYEYGSEWQVLPSENMLFHDVAHPQFPQKCIVPEDPRGDRRRRLDESTVSEVDAEKACAAIKDPLDRKDCVYDILATQDLGMIGAY